MAAYKLTYYIYLLYIFTIYIFTDKLIEAYINVEAYINTAYKYTQL